ncbi:MAG: hypothetical protein GQ532_05180 [Methylomarinum sp.]|nr:hypothetical protein [Methylomarinum sp.]
MVNLNSKIKLLKGYELFDNIAYKKCVDEYKERHADISSSKIAELSQLYLEKEIAPRMIERLYKGELKQLKTEKINALQLVFEELNSLPKNSVAFRKNPTIHTPEKNNLLNDIQTRNLINLHINSSAHFMFLLVENVINFPNNHNRSSFHETVHAFLSESRILCYVFESNKLGNIYEFLRDNFDDLINNYTDEAFDKIIFPEKDSSVKKAQMMGFIRKKQSELQRIVDKALSDKN